MSMTIDWTDIFEQYKGLWVALKEDQKTVIAHGKKASKVLEEAKLEGYDNPILFKVPVLTGSYIGIVDVQSGADL